MSKGDEGDRQQEWREHIQSTRRPYRNERREYRKMPEPDRNAPRQDTHIGHSEHIRLRHRF